MLRVLSLFSGIGAFEVALRNLNINYELVNYCEIDKYASKSYSLIHNVSEDMNLGDITKIIIDDLPLDIDLITHGSPCQSFSVSGLQHGGTEGSGTRSSLMWNSVEIIKQRLPKYVIWENVKNVLSPKHKCNFDRYIEELNSLGYTSYYKVLNSKDYGVPQNRERIFVISILGDHSPFEFPSKQNLTLSMNDLLEQEVPDKFYMNKPFSLLTPKNDQSVCKQIARLDIKGNDSMRRVYDPNYCCPTLTTCGGGNTEAKILVTKDGQNVVRKLTPKEYWRLQGFSDEDFDKCKEAGLSNSQLYKQAGNSITVLVLEAIYRNLFIDYIQ